MRYLNLLHAGTGSRVSTRSVSRAAVRQPAPPSALVPGSEGTIPDIVLVPNPNPVDETSRPVPRRAVPGEFQSTLPRGEYSVYFFIF
jgi:hypothetical protein